MVSTGYIVRFCHKKQTPSQEVVAHTWEMVIPALTREAEAG